MEVLRSNFGKSIGIYVSLKLSSRTDS